MICRNSFILLKALVRYWIIISYKDGFREEANYANRDEPVNFSIRG